MNQILNGVLVFGKHDQNTLDQIVMCKNTEAAHAVLCADGHYGYNHPIGGVVALKEKISISAVGFDIGCGNLAVRLDAKRSDIAPKINTIMDDIVKNISFGVGRTNNLPVDHPVLHDPLFQTEPYKSWLADATAQLGTVGSGNHYVDIFADENDDVWVGVHFGSRGLGHKTATHFLKAAGADNSMAAPPCIVDASTALGSDYIAGMKLAGEYAYAGRQQVVDVVTKMLGATVLESIHNHHNFAWLEDHFGEDFWVVRKGSTPAFPGQKGFVGGSMGDNAVILEGVDSELSKKALYSTVHGAGRIMSRNAAKGKFVKDAAGKKQRQPGLVRHDEMVKWLSEKGVVLRGGDLDEAPQAYRRLPDVIADQGETVRVIRTLQPLGVAMAGSDIIDPYKD